MILTCSSLYTEIFKTSNQVMLILTCSSLYTEMVTIFLPCRSAHKCQTSASSDCNGLTILLCHPIPFYCFHLLRPFITKVGTSNSYILKENCLKLCMLAQKSHISLWHFNWSIFLSSYCTFDLKNEEKKPQKPSHQNGGGGGGGGGKRHVFSSDKQLLIFVYYL